MTDAEREAAISQILVQVSGEAGIGLFLPTAEGAYLMISSGNYGKAFAAACNAMMESHTITTSGIFFEVREKGQTVASCKCRPRDLDLQIGAAAVSSCYR
jgi:hypothetical protein